MRLARLGIAALAFAAFFTAFFAPALFGGTYLTALGDGSELALPFYMVPHGLWEPDIMLGYPWGSNLNGYWDPLFLLHLIPHSFNAYMLCAYAIAAVGAFGLVDALTGSALGGTIAGLTYALGGFMIGHLLQYDVVHPAAWVPYVLWAMVALRRNGGVRPVVLGAAAVALCALAGQPQVLTYALLLALAYVACTVRGAAAPARFAGGAVLAIGAGILLAAIALAPGALLALSSFRAHPGLDAYLNLAEPPQQLALRLFAPYALAATPPFRLPAVPVAGTVVEQSAYVGIVTLILALVAVLGRQRDPEVPFFALAALAALLLSTGNGLHVDAIAFHVPLLNLYRFPGRHMLEFTLLVAVLAGIGAADLAHGSVSARRLGLALAAVGAALAATVATAFGGGAPAGALALPVVAFVGGAGVLIALRGAPESRPAALAVTVCVLADLGSIAWFQYWRTPVSAALLQPPPAAVRLRAVLERTHQRMFSVAGATPGVGLEPNLSLVWGVPAAGGFVQMLLTAPGIFLQLYPQGTMADRLLYDDRDRSLDLAAIRYVLIPADRAPAFAAARPEWLRRGVTPQGAIFENPHAEARARVVHRVIALSPDAALRAIRAASLDTHATALLQGPGALDTPADPRDGARITALQADDMEVAVRCRTACFLETSDTYDGMWQATIDGGAVPLRLSDYALRGVFVPPGTHAVAFRYRPWIIALGAALSATTALALAGVVVGASLARRARPVSGPR